MIILFLQLTWLFNLRFYVLVSSFIFVVHCLTISAFCCFVSGGASKQPLSKLIRLLHLFLGDTITGLDLTAECCTPPLSRESRLARLCLQLFHSKARFLYWYNPVKNSVADSGCLSGIHIFSIPNPGSASKNLGILT